MAHFLLGIFRKASAEYDAYAAEVNGQPGFVVTFEGKPQAAWSFQIYDGQIHTIYVVLNPEKLTRI